MANGVIPPALRCGKESEVARGCASEVDAAAAEDAEAVARQEQLVEARCQPLIAEQRAGFGGERGGAAPVDVSRQLGVVAVGDAVEVPARSRLVTGFGHEQGEVAVPDRGGAARQRPA